MRLPFSYRPSLLWRILFSTSIAITFLLVLTGWFVHDLTLNALSRSLQAEIQSGFRAYQSLWQSRADTLRSVSLVLSSMSDVRRAFGTADRATIRDTAAEMWSKVAQSSGLQSNAMFLVTDAEGVAIASLGGGDELASLSVPVVGAAAPRFPSQSDGFALNNGRLYEMVITPVYVDTPNGSLLLNVLAAGFPVDQATVEELKQRTGGSDLIFVARKRALISTLPPALAGELAAAYRRNPGLQDLKVSNGGEYAVLGSELLDIGRAPAGDLLIVRSFESIRRDITSLERQLLFVWAAAILAALGLSFLLARRVLRPVKELDRAASLIAEKKYDTRVPVHADDELGRFARTFNAMCASIQDARDELIRHEQIATIGRLSSSIVHDLRNPLASIYGGAEMLMDGDLTESQAHRVAGNIYRSSRIINEMLQELVNVSRGRMQAPELCRLSDVIGAAVDAQAATAEQQNVEISVSCPDSIELNLERARMERVFLNLISNALDAMPGGGRLRITAETEGSNVVIRVEDTGPGIPPEIRERLFHPFVSSGRTGLGLGLALSRQTVLDHGGNLSVADSAQGACFLLRLPLAQ
jgi:signal transduction histidine kinase